MHLFSQLETQTAVTLSSQARVTASKRVVRIPSLVQMYYHENAKACSNQTTEKESRTTLAPRTELVRVEGCCSGGPKKKSRYFCQPYLFSHSPAMFVPTCIGCSTICGSPSHLSDSSGKGHGMMRGSSILVSFYQNKKDSHKPFSGTQAEPQRITRGPVEVRERRAGPCFLRHWRKSFHPSQNGKIRNLALPEQSRRRRDSPQPAI